VGRKHKKHYKKYKDISGREKEGRVSKEGGVREGQGSYVRFGAVSRKKKRKGQNNGEKGERIGRKKPPQPTSKKDTKKATGKSEGPTRGSVNRKDQRVKTGTKGTTRAHKTDK